MPTLFFLKESMEISNVPMGELLCLLEMEGIVAKISTCFKYSIIVDYDIQKDTLIKIVKNSGYIHSAGPLVFDRHWNKISHMDIGQDIKNYVKKKQTHIDILIFEKPEDSKKSITLWEKRNKSILEAQINAKKAFLGRMSFKKMIRIISKDIEDTIRADGTVKPFQKNNGALFIYNDFCTQNRDNDKDTIFKYPGYNVDTHLICYHSIVRNIDPVLHFGEKKPYWAGIFTTPQPLMTSMVNMSKTTKGNKILEPFTHMAGVPLQAVRLGIHCCAYDKEGIKGGYDNITFFTMNQDKANTAKEKIYNICTSMADQKSIEDKENFSIRESILKDAKNSVKKPLGEDQYPTLNWFPEHNSIYTQLEHRIIFFIARRYFYETNAELKDDTNKELNKYLQDELEKMNHYIEDLGSIGQYDNNTNVFQVALQNKDGNCSEISHFEYGDVLEVMPAIASDTFDAIITDPPYGAGVDEGSQTSLIEIYNVFLNESFRILKNNGKLIFCTLWKSKTGKMIAKDLCTEGVVATLQEIVQANGYRIQPIITKNEFNNNKNFIYEHNDFSINLFYWKSKKFLDRGIIALNLIKN